jgi:hypothetical protein
MMTQWEWFNLAAFSVGLSAAAVTAVLLVAIAFAGL